MTDKINRPTGYGMTAEVKKKVGRTVLGQMIYGFESKERVRADSKSHALLSLSFALRLGRTRHPSHEFPHSRSKVSIVTLKRLARSRI